MHQYILMQLTCYLEYIQTQHINACFPKQITLPPLVYLPHRVVCRCMYVCVCIMLWLQAIVLHSLVCRDRRSKHTHSQLHSVLEYPHPTVPKPKLTLQHCTCCIANIFTHVYHPVLHTHSEVSNITKIQLQQALQYSSATNTATIAVQTLLHTNDISSNI